MTFFFKALAFFSSLRSLSRLFHSLIDRTVNVRPPSVSFLKRGQLKFKLLKRVLLFWVSEFNLLLVDWRLS